MGKNIKKIARTETKKINKSVRIEPAAVEPFLLRTWRPYLLIAGLGAVIYLKAVFFGLAYLDDNNLILDNFYFIKNIGSIIAAFGQDIFRLFNGGEIYYRPLLTVSLILDAQISGINPLFYHITNVILHLLASCLVFALVKELKYKKELALIFSLIFVAHPILSQAVAWIPGRNDSLMTVLVLASFIFFLKLEGKYRDLNAILSLLFFFLAMLTKETSLILVPICLLFALLMKRPKLKAGYWVLMAAGWGAAACSWFLLRSAALKHPAELKTIYIIQSLFNNLPAVLIYVGKIFLPFNLSVLPILRDTNFIYGGVSLIILLIWILFSKGKDMKMVWFGTGWFLLFLLPSFIRPNPDLPADFIEHRAYLPLIGMLIILIETFKNTDLKKRGAVLASIAILVFLSAVTFIHLDVFRDRISFWKNAAANSPHYPLAHRNLGAMYYLNGELEKAVPEYKKALELNPAEPMAHNNLGLIYMRQNHRAEAEKEFIAEIAINPTYDTVYFNLGLLYYSERRAGDAEKAWKKTVELNPEYIEAYKYLAVLYLYENRIPEAISNVEQMKRRGVEVPAELLKALKLY